MAMGRQGDRQGDLMVTWSEMPRSPGHVFYDRLQEVLAGAGFDGFVEEACQAYYARTMGAPSVPPQGKRMKVCDPIAGALSGRSQVRKPCRTQKGAGSEDRLQTYLRDR